MRLKEYISESDRGRTLILVDIDDTTFMTYAMIRVMKDGQEVAKLNNQEYNAYTLKDGESVDFSEFSDADFFHKTSKPIRTMVAKLRAMMGNNAKVVFITARADFNDRDRFLDTFRKYGMDPDKFYIERAGNLKRGTVPERKVYIILKNYLSHGIYRRAVLYDDFMGNCKSFLELKEKVPPEILDTVRKTNNITDPNEIPITFKAYQVNGDGTMREVK